MKHKEMRQLLGTRKPIPMYLQYFAGSDDGSDGGSGDAADDPDDDDGSDDDNSDDKEPEITPEVQKLIDSAIGREKARLKAKYEKEKKDAESKAARLASMSEKERKEEEAKEREAKLDEREKEIQYKEYRLEAVKQLEDQKLSGDFADMVLAEEPEDTTANIKTLRKQIDVEVEAEVKKRLAGKGISSGTKTSTVSAGEQVAKERNEIKKVGGLDPWAKK